MSDWWNLVGLKRSGAGRGESGLPKLQCGGGGGGERFKRSDYALLLKSVVPRREQPRFLAQQFNPHYRRVFRQNVSRAEHGVHCVTHLSAATPESNKKLCAVA